MPHTSHHKKKRARSKRQEVVGDDGWTRIITTTSANKPLPDGPLIPRPEAATAIAAPEGLALSDIHAKYIEMEAKWKASESWTCVANNILKTPRGGVIIGSDTRIDACVLFGSGSFTGLRDGWINRTHVALCQLAAFKAVVDLLGKYIFFPIPFCLPHPLPPLPPPSL